MSASSRARPLMTIAMNVVLAVAIVLAVRVVIEFFGALAASPPGAAVVDATAFLVPDLGISHMRTPYGGIFEPEAAFVIGALLLIEWALALARSRG